MIDSAFDTKAPKVCYLLYNWNTYLPLNPDIHQLIIITGDHSRPDLLLSTANTILCIIELTARFETNLNNNESRPYDNYHNFEFELPSEYHKVKFCEYICQLSRSLWKTYNTFIQICNDFDFDKKHLNYFIMKLTTIIIRTT